MTEKGAIDQRTERDRRDDLLVSVGVACLAIVSAGVARWIAVHGLGDVPHVMDEIAYTLQAKTLAGGHVSSPVGYPRAAFNMWFVEDRSTRFSIFPPGWPLVLALGVKLGIPGAVNPTLHALTVWWVGRAGRVLSGPKLQLLAAALYAVSPQAILLAASLMSHTVVAACGAIVLLTTIRMLEKKIAWQDFLAAGAAIGLTATTRPLCACVLFLTFAVAGMIARPPLRLLAWAGPPLVLSVVLLGIYNGILTGSALRFPQSLYFDEHKPPVDLPIFHYAQGCNDLGFGRTHGCDDSIRGGYHTLDNALSNTGDNLTAWFLLAGGGPLLVVAVLAAAYTAYREPRLRRALGVAFTALACAIVLYGLYWYAGTCYGGRFYHAAFPALMFTCAIGLARFPRRAAIAVAFALFVAWNGYALKNAYAELPGYWGVDDRFARVRKTWDHEPALVMVAFDDAQIRVAPLRWTSTLIRGGLWLNSIRSLGALAENTPNLDGPIVFVKFHPGLVDRLRERFPGRQAWLYVAHADAKDDTIAPYEPALLPYDEPRLFPADNFDGFKTNGEPRPPIDPEDWIGAW